MRRKESLIPFTAGDGFACNLIHIEGEKPAPKGPVLLVHGAGVRANIFRAPVAATIVDYLIENGYDVWLENWRASIDFPPNLWSLDQAALYDHPEAVKTVVQKTGCEEIKAVIHCQGSTSFMMSAILGKIPQVKTIVSNAVSLHPVVPTLSKIKLNFAVPFVNCFIDYLNPQWGLKRPKEMIPKLLSWLIELTHHECDNAVCKHVSFDYGSGFPALWSHGNLNEETHAWLKHEFAHCPIKFFLQMARSVGKGHLVPYDRKEEIPEDFVKQGPKTDARFAFFAGKDNLCFLPESQEKTFHYFNQYKKDYHALHIVSGYGHLDIFMGKNTAKDVFPMILQELDKPN